MNEEMVSRRLCETLHSRLDRACEERHRGLDERIDGLTDALREFSRELRTAVVERATDRAWALIGKYGITLAALVATLFGIASYLKG